MITRIMFARMKCFIPIFTEAQSNLCHSQYCNNHTWLQLISMKAAAVCIFTVLTIVHGGPVKRSESVTTLTDADFDAARRRSTPSEAEIESEFENVWKSGYFEGDIKNDIASVIEDVSHRGAAVRYENQLWSDSRVPYLISTDFSPYARAEIAAAFLEYEKHTCVRFVPHSNEYDYIKFFEGDGCWSYVGRTGGRQEISIGSGCAYKGTIMHEMMHALGFYHEQSRVDRDKYIEVLWRNIKPGMDDQFQKYDLSETQLLDTKYDYDSIMHYGEYGFSRYGAPTIRRLRGTGRLGQREGFSKIDLIEINRLYKCAQSPAVNTGGESSEIPGIGPSVTGGKILSATKYVGRNIPDEGSMDAVIAVDDDGVVTDVNVEVTLEHDWPSDLKLAFIAPDNTQVVLVCRIGMSGSCDHPTGLGYSSLGWDTFTGTIFDQEARKSIKDKGHGPKIGRYRPAEDLSVLNGKSVRGNWKLRISDNEEEDTGRMINWTLEITTQCKNTDKQ